MERKEINSSIKLNTIKNRLERINKITKRYKYEIIKVKKNIFNYEINRNQKMMKPNKI